MITFKGFWFLVILGALLGCGHQGGDGENENLQLRPSPPEDYEKIPFPIHETLGNPIDSARFWLTKNTPLSEFRVELYNTFTDLTEADSVHIAELTWALNDSTDYDRLTIWYYGCKMETTQRALA